MVKILLAEGDTFYRIALKMLIEKNSEAEVEIISPLSMNKKGGRSYHDIILLDIDLPGLNAAGLISNMLSEKKQLRILVMSTLPELPYAKMYLQVGARGYINKSSPETEFIKAIDTILAGKRYVSNIVESEIVKDALTGRSANPFDNLSARELEILWLMLRNKTVTEIGDQLRLRPSTISTFKSRIYDKLKTKNIIEIGALARVYGVGG